MATPYSVLRLEEAPSTQDLARARFTGTPFLVVADRQTEGRGRSGTRWETAPRAVAASLALRLPSAERMTVLPLIAGVAAVRVLGSGFGLKWPNDVMAGELKVGGVLVEASGEVAVVGIGLNLWWPDPPPGIGSVHPADPGNGDTARVAQDWAGALIELAGAESWPRAEYLERCLTLGRRLTWQPDGAGRAVDVADDGGLVVETETGLMTIRSGAVTHVRG